MTNGPSLIGGGNPAGRSVQKLGTEALLQADDPLAENRLSHADTPRRRADGATLDDGEIRFDIHELELHRHIALIHPWPRSLTRLAIWPSLMARLG